MQVYANPASCNSFYKCENGTATGEECENGLLFDPLLALTDAVHNYCVYTWRAECGARPADRRPEPSPGAEPVTEWWRCRMVAPPSSSSSSSMVGVHLRPPRLRVPVRAVPAGRRLPDLLYQVRYGHSLTGAYTALQSCQNTVWCQTLRKRKTLTFFSTKKGL